MSKPNSGAAVVLLAFLAGACGDPASPGSGGTPVLGLSVLPIGGVMNQDWYMTNYVDVVPGPGTSDYACGQKTYNGHQGIDLVLPSFAAMDEGVPVLAAAPGVVSFTHDGEFDRNTVWSNVDWNVVRVDHGDGFEAAYGHLKQGSLRVQVGDAVEAGDTLALVGSSGRSDMPHVHFELLHNGVVVDPFAGECGGDTGQWTDAIPYQNEFHLIDAGVTTQVLRDGAGLAEVKGPPPAAGTVTAGQVLYHWVHLHNARAARAVTWSLVAPDGSARETFTGSLSNFYSMSWWWVVSTTEGYEPGEWTMRFRYDGEVVADRTFTIVAGEALRASAAATSVRGWGGGGIR